MKPHLLLGLFLFATACATTSTLPESSLPRVEWDGDTFKVVGLTPDELESHRNRKNWDGVFEIVVEGAQDPPSLMGSYGVGEDIVWFRPRFRLVEGLSYRTRFAGLEETSMTVPRKPRQATRVASIYPSTSTLPENVLRFYVHFSESMTQGSAYEFVSILDENGDKIVDPFLEVGEELWDPDARRLTLLIHPGRIKSGLMPRRELGPVFIAGKTYRLKIDSAWPDAYGLPLRESFQKKFRASAADLQRPDPFRWTIQSPVAGTNDAIRVSIIEPLDRALLERLVWVRNAEGDPVKGDIRIDDDERSWSLVPKSPWLPGEYELIVEQALEDLAGNNLANLFEVDVFDRIEDGASPPQGIVPFRIELASSR